jgi:hypothetical protein
MRIRHSTSKLYCTLVLVGGEASGGARQARVSTWLPVAAVTLSLPDQRGGTRSPIQARAKPTWETGSSAGRGVADELELWRTEIA